MLSQYFCNSSETIAILLQW